MKLSEITKLLQTLPNTVNLCIFGGAGIGKTAAIDEHYADATKYVRIYFCPAQQEATESAGLPSVITIDGIEYCSKAMPLWWRVVQDAVASGRIPVVFVDELDKAPMSVQNALLELFGRTRSLAGQKLPPETILICAGNRAEDRSGSQKMSMALGNRLMQVTAEPDANVWLDWAQEAGLNMTVRAYLALRPENLYAFDATARQYPSPRTWHAVSDCLNNGMGNLPLNLLLEAMTGLLGKSVGTEFAALADSMRQLPCTVEDVWKDAANAPLPASTAISATYAIATALVGRSDSTERVNAALTYALRLPAAFAVLVADALYRLTDKRQYLTACKAWTAFTVKYGDQLAAIA